VGFDVAHVCRLGQTRVQDDNPAFNFTSAGNSCFLISSKGTPEMNQKQINAKFYYEINFY
jgi:hypothetical protein